MRIRRLFAVAGVLALASCKDSDEERRSDSRAQAVAPQSVKVDAQQAIAAATAAVPGSAQEVRLESRKGKPEYEVMVLPSGATSRVRVEVDATNGAGDEIGDRLG
jgi:uncharacterized membrane protein YkoI